MRRPIQAETRRNERHVFAASSASKSKCTNLRPLFADGKTSEIARPTAEASRRLKNVSSEPNIYSVDQQKGVIRVGLRSCSAGDTVRHTHRQAKGSPESTPVIDEVRRPEQHFEESKRERRNRAESK